MTRPSPSPWLSAEVVVVDSRGLVADEGALGGHREVGQVGLRIVLRHREFEGSRLGGRDGQLALPLVVGRPGELERLAGDRPKERHERAGGRLAALGHRDGK